MLRAPMDQFCGCLWPLLGTGTLSLSVGSKGCAGHWHGQWGLLMEQLLLRSVCRKVPLHGVFPVREGSSGVSLAPAPGEEAPYRR